MHGGELLCGQGAIGIGLGYDHAGERRNQNVNDTRHVLIGQRGAQQRGAILYARIDLVQCAHKVLAALRVMTGVDQLERIGSQHIKATRRGAAHKRRIELVMIELATQIPLAQHDRTRGILRLIRRLNHARRIDGTRRSTAKLHGIAHVLRHLGRGMVHHQRHNAALATTRIHHALNTHLMRALAQNNQAPRLNNRSLLPRNSLERIAQNSCVVEPDAGNGNGDGIGRARSIPASAHANLEHGNIHRSLGKHDKRGSRQQVKRRDGIGALPRRHTTGIHSMSRLNSGRNATGKRLIAHNAPVNLHALGITHQLRRRIQCGL